MLHAYLLSQSGIPVLYSGDEIGQLNDYAYKEDPYKQADSRYLHRGSFPWESVKEKVPQRIFKGLRRLEKIRAAYEIFGMEAEPRTFEAGNPHVLGISRELGKKKFVAYYNFSEEPVKVEGRIPECCGMEMLDDAPENQKGFIDLVTGKEISGDIGEVEGYGYLWLYRETED